VSDDPAVAESGTLERKRERRVKWSVRLGTAMLSALMRTWRIVLVHHEPIAALREAKKPMIFTFWHAGLLPLLVIHRRTRAAVLVSDHADGEVVSRVLESLGYTTVRGSSTRGAERALLGMIRAVSGGLEAGVTPDGPRGPAHEFKQGALVIAQRSGAPIVLVGVAASHAWRLKSWDRFLIPKPFAKVVAVYGQPIYFSGVTAREASARAPEMTEQLHRLGEEAERLLRGDAASAGQE
jgi:lysophospholipid acyltransferase (LPLAT)-like uncharacterized protein